MNCPKCGIEVNESQRFCHGCGNAISAPNYSSQDEATAPKRRQEYVGVLYKCPNCGEGIGSYQTHCQTCGYELRGASASSSVKQLTMQLDTIEMQRPRKKKRRFFTQNNELDETDQRKITLIRSFGIPNTREDLLDFAVLAASNIDYSDYEDDGRSLMSEAWMSALRQSYEKSRIICEDSQESNAIKRLIDESEKKVRKAKRKPWLMVAKIFGVLFGIILVLLVVIGIQRVVQGDEYDINVEQRHLEYVLDDIEDDIAAGRFEDAKNKAYTLVFDSGLSVEKAEYWENKQKEVLRQIERAENRET